jgi:hypothetical protein
VAAQAQARGEKIVPSAPAGLSDDLKGLTTAGLMQIDSDGRVQAYVEVDRVDLDVIDDLAAAGVTIQRVASDSLTVQGLVPVTNLDAVAGLDAVKQVRLPSYGFVQTGSVTTQGDAIVRAGLARQVFGVTGAGVRVGVISDGVAGLGDAQARGDLPPSVNIQTCNAILHGNPPGPFGFGDPRAAGAEGTALLEIVHDIAPDAELWFGYFGQRPYLGGTDEDFDAAVDCLAANTDVVVDDVSFYDSGPYNGESVASSNTSYQLNLTTNPIRVYSTSVGNQAVKHYQGQFVDSGGSHPGWHEFGANGEATDARGQGPRSSDSLWLAQDGGDGNSSATVTVYLQWNDQWGKSSNDYNLYLYKEGANGQPAGTAVASSENVQGGSGNPVESLTYDNPGAAGYFDIVVVKASGGPRILDMFLNWGQALPLPGTSSYHNFNTVASSVPNQGDAGHGVISVGAISASDPGNDTIESFSSRGPTEDNRTKPDITGIDQVRVSGAGGFGSTLGGTSASAPDVAGVAALLLQCRPDLKAGEPGDNPSADRTTLRNLILDNAVDLGAPGMDNTFGAGRLDAYESALAAGGKCQPADRDGDGVPDVVDNCPYVSNPDQLNTDAKPIDISPIPPGQDATVPNGDNLGDACDPDIDNDWMLNTGANPTLGIPGEDVGCGSGPTNPKLMDTDGDTVVDGYECLVGTNPNDPLSKPSFNLTDSDRDGLPDSIEVLFGSDPHKADTDGDGIPDGIEVKGRGTSPLMIDTDTDGCDDNIGIADINGDGRVNFGDRLIISKAAAHLIAYNADIDVNEDGIVNVADILLVARQLGKTCALP